MSSVLLSLTLLFLALADEVDSHSSLHTLGQNNQGLNSIAKPFWEETNSKHTHTHSEKQTWACTSGPSPPVVLKILVGFGRLIMAGTS